MTVEDWEAAFHGIDLPETAQLDTEVFIFDIKGFLEKSFGILRAGNERVSEPMRCRLQKLLDITNQANAVKE